MFYLIFDVAYIQTFLCDIFSGHFSDEQTDILSARYSDILSYTHSDMLSKVLPDICLDTNFDNRAFGIVFGGPTKSAHENVWVARPESQNQLVILGSCWPRLRQGTNRVKAHQAGIKSAVISRDPRLVRNNMYFS